MNKLELRRPGPSFTNSLKLRLKLNSSTKNPVSKKEGIIHSNNHCQLNDMITKFDKYDGIILNLR